MFSGFPLVRDASGNVPFTLSFFFIPFPWKGQDGIFSLSLIGDNGTFEISPPVAENAANFVIRVKNSAHLNFEKTRQMRFKVKTK